MKYKMLNLDAATYPFFPDEVEALLNHEHEVLEKQTVGDTELYKIDVSVVPGVNTFKHKRTLWFRSNCFKEVKCSAI